MFFRLKKSGERAYVQIVENKRQRSRSVKLIGAVLPIQRATTGSSSPFRLLLYLQVILTGINIGVTALR
jgi:hypothetical protein